MSLYECQCPNCGNKFQVTIAQKVQKTKKKSDGKKNANILKDKGFWITVLTLLGLYLLAGGHIG